MAFAPRGPATPGTPTHRLSRAARGRLIAASLAGVWRPRPPPWSLGPDELATAVPMLLASGSGALAWWRLQGSPVAATPPAAALGDAYRFHALEAVLRARDLQRIVLALRSAGVEPLLMKGWAAAQLYPEPGLRPYSDVDLFVLPAWQARAQDVLAHLDPVGTAVDLHARIPDMPDRAPEELYAGSRELTLDGTPVRVLGPEDHLRLLCLHQVRHGLRRPVWLCDIGAAVESLPPEFDPSACLRGEPHRSEWVACVLGLARTVLDARLDAWPAHVQRRCPPAWTVATLLREWGGRYQPHPSQQMADVRREPRRLAEALRERWPNPVEATYWLGGATGARWRLPFQLRAYAERGLAFVARPGDEAEHA